MPGVGCLSLPAGEETSRRSKQRIPVSMHSPQRFFNALNMCLSYAFTTGVSLTSIAPCFVSAADRDERATGSVGCAIPVHRSAPRHCCRKAIYSSFTIHSNTRVVFFQLMACWLCWTPPDTAMSSPGTWPLGAILGAQWRLHPASPCEDFL